MNQLAALCLSIAIEAPSAALAMFFMGKKNYLSAAGVAAGSTLLSHPFAWAANTYWLSSWPFWQRSLVIESSVVIFEALFYWYLCRLRLAESLFVSLFANGASFGVGLLLWLVERS